MYVIASGFLCSSGGDDPANNIFYLDVQTGELRLYRELREITTTDYFLCIRTATDPNLDYSQISDNYGQSDSQMLSLHVQIRNGTVPEEGPDDRYNLGDFGARRRNNIIHAGKYHLVDNSENLSLISLLIFILIFVSFQCSDVFRCRL